MVEKLLRWAMAYKQRANLLDREVLQRLHNALSKATFFNSLEEAEATINAILASEGYTVYRLRLNGEQGSERFAVEKVNPEDPFKLDQVRDFMLHVSWRPASQEGYSAVSQREPAVYQVQAKLLVRRGAEFAEKKPIRISRDGPFTRPSYEKDD